MQRLQGWVRYAAQQLPVGAAAGTKPQQQQHEEDEEDFIYGRVAVHSDDEEPDHRTSSAQQQRRMPAPVPDVDLLGAPADPQQQQQQQQQPGIRPMHHQHSYSDTNLQELQVQAEQMQEGPELIRLDSDEGQQQEWATDWAAIDDQQAAAAAAQRAGAGGSGGPAGSPAVGRGSSSGAAHEHPSSSGNGVGAAAAAAAGSSGVSQPPAAAAAATAEDLKFEAPTTSTVFDTGEEVPDHDHTQERRELIIYAIPLQSKKIIFLPVCPWRTDPEAGPGWKKAVAGHVNKVQGEASSMWQKMADAEKGSAVHRLYKFGKRLLESVPAEERLMRGVPKNVSKVIIHHPTQVSPESIMEQMQTMTKNYGIKAVGRAAAATVMLPLAIGVDLIILPGPQVLTYYTMWQMYRNTDGAVGTTRMTKFITQGGSSNNIRVNYAAEPRLDRYYDLANDCPDGVLSEDDIEALVNDIREPDLLEALMSLRSKALRDANARTSRGGDEYTALPPMDPGASPTAFGAAHRNSSARF